MLIDYGIGPKECRFGVNAMCIYEQEFHADIIQDLFGKIDVKDDQSEDGVLFSVDYRQTNWTNCVKALWAGLKNADERTPPWKEWSRSTEGIDLNEISNKVIHEAWRMFFRAGASDSE